MKTVKIFTTHHKNICRPRGSWWRRCVSRSASAGVSASPWASCPPPAPPPTSSPRSSSSSMSIGTFRTPWGGCWSYFLCAMCIHLYYTNFAAGTRGHWWNSTKTTLSLFLQSWGERRMMPTCPPSSRCPPATTPRSCGGTPAARRPSPRRTRCPCPGPCATSAPCWGGELWLQCTNWLSSQQIIVKINSKILYWEREAGKYCTMVLTYLL